MGCCFYITTFITERAVRYTHGVEVFIKGTVPSQYSSKSSDVPPTESQEESHIFVADMDTFFGLFCPVYRDPVLVKSSFFPSGDNAAKI